MDEYLKDFEGMPIRAEKYIREVLSPLLPNASLMSWLSSSISNESDIQINLNSFNILKDSEYELYFEDTVHLIHFTSINNLFSIIRSKSLWMKDLNSMKDKSEFIFANKHLPQQESIKLKEKIVSLSFCEFSEENIKNNFMWNEYGDKHRGVCIKLKYRKQDDAVTNINPFYLGKIKYHDKNNPIKELELLKKRHDNFREKNGYSATNINEILFVVSALYKEKIMYKQEEEVRLFKYLENSNLFNKTEFMHDSDTKQMNSFIQFPLNSKNEELYTPVLTIEELIFGKNIDLNTIREIETKYIDVFNAVPNIKYI